MEELLTYLQTQGIGTKGTTLFGIGLPDTALGTAMVGLLETPGLPPVRAMSASLAAPVLEAPRYSVYSRATDYATARAKARAAMNVLDNLHDVTLSGIRYHRVEALQRPPYFLERDTNGRTVFAFAVQVWKNPGSSTSSSTST